MQLARPLRRTSPAFTRELLRRGAPLAADESENPLRVTERHVLAALGELLEGGEELMKHAARRPP